MRYEGRGQQLRAVRSVQNTAAVGGRHTTPAAIVFQHLILAGGHYRRVAADRGVVLRAGLGWVLVPVLASDRHKCLR